MASRARELRRRTVAGPRLDMREVYKSIQKKKKKMREVYVVIEPYLTEVGSARRLTLMTSMTRTPASPSSMPGAKA